MSRIALIGRVPPPYGGVSVHVMRLCKYLRAQNIDAVVWDYDGKEHAFEGVVRGQRGWFAFANFLAFGQWDVLELNTNSVMPIVASAAFASLRRRRLVITLHSMDVIARARRLPALFQTLLRRAFATADPVVCVNQRLADWLSNFSAQATAMVLPAYLPPTVEELKSDTLPAEVTNFRSRIAHMIVVQGVWGGARGEPHVYGFREAIDALSGLRQLGYNCGIALLVGSCYDKEHRDSIIDYYHTLHLEDRVLLCEHGTPGAALIKMSDVLLRPTITDGDSVSVREALDLGVPVVASNCIDRPKGVSVYPTGSTTAMIERLLHIINSPTRHTYEDTHNIGSAAVLRWTQLLLPQKEIV